MKNKLQKLKKYLKDNGLDKHALSLEKLTKKAFVPPVILAVPISVEFGIAMAGALETALGISTIAGLSLTAYLYSLQDKGITHFTIEDLGLENPETEAKLAQLYKEKGNNVTEEDIMNAIVPKRNPNFKLPETSYSDLKERPKTTKKPKINIYDLLNPDNEVDDEEREKETIPVYCFMVKFLNVPGKVTYVCFKSKKRMIETYETYDVANRRIMYDEIGPDFILFRREHPLSNQSKLRSWVGCKSGSLISFEDYSNGPGVEWLDRGAANYLRSQGIVWKKYMSDKPEITELPC